MKRWMHISFLVAAVTLVPAIAPMPAPGQEDPKGFLVTVLASNRPGLSENTDSRLLDPWSMTAMRTGPWWIANSGSGRLAAYNGGGNAVPLLNPLSVSVPAAPGSVSETSSPVGVVFNDTAGFELGPSEPAWFIIGTREGQLAGWFPGYEAPAAVIRSDEAPEAGFTGIALAGDRLYAANFAQDRIDVFADDFSPIDMGGASFADPGLPEGLSPYNVRALGNRIYVSYAAPDAGRRVAAAGRGHVAVFDRRGNFLLALEPGPWLNAPWGIALAPAPFGGFGNDVLVANSGSGRIAAFDARTGAFRGYLTDPQGTPLRIPGLHAIAFGNDDEAGPSGTLYFTAGAEGGRVGIFGSLVPVPGPPGTAGPGTTAPESTTEARPPAAMSSPY